MRQRAQLDRSNGTQTGSADRLGNMIAFATAALALLAEQVEG